MRKFIVYIRFSKCRAFLLLVFVGNLVSTSLQLKLLPAISNVPTRAHSKLNPSTTSSSFHLTDNTGKGFIQLKTFGKNGIVPNNVENKVERIRRSIQNSTESSLVTINLPISAQASMGITITVMVTCIYGCCCCGLCYYYRKNGR